MIFADFILYSAKSGFFKNTIYDSILEAHRQKDAYFISVGNIQEIVKVKIGSMKRKYTYHNIV